MKRFLLKWLFRVDIGRYERMEVVYGHIMYCFSNRLDYTSNHLHVHELLHDVVVILNNHINGIETNVENIKRLDREYIGHTEIMLVAALPRLLQLNPNIQLGDDMADM
jgi:hypothetical protein